MRPRPLARVCLVLLFAVVWLSPSVGQARQEGPPRGFYFLGPHLFPFNHGIIGLLPQDMDGDGRTDLVLMDRKASKFHLLTQQKEEQEREPEERPEWAEPSVNELEADRLLGKKEIRIDEPLKGYVTGGFGGSEAAIAYLTARNELVVESENEEGLWVDRQRFLLDLTSNFVGGFENADLDGNGMDDLVLLAEDELLVLYQDGEGRLSEPQRHPVAREKSSRLLLEDADNDGRPDLIYLAPGTRYPLRIRLTQPDGVPGPEYRFRMAAAPRGIAVGDCLGEEGNELVIVESATNRIKLLRWQMQEEGAPEGAEPGALELVPFPRDEKAGLRDFVIADVDGSGLPDLVVSEPDAARMSLIRSEEGSGLLPLESFPSLQESSGMGALRAPDGTTELVLCSKKEEIVGVSRFDAKTGRLEFPRPIDLEGTPHSIAVVPGSGERAGRVFCALEGPAPEEGEDGPVELVTLLRTEQGYAPELRQTLEDLDNPPAGLMAVDPDGDGRADLLAFPEYQSPLLLMQSAEGRFEVVSEEPGFGKHMLRELGAAAVATARPRAGQPPALLLAGGNLVRVVRYTEGNLVVQDQFSSENPRSSYAALAAADLDGDGVTEILVADQTRNWLSVLELSEKDVYRVARNIEIGPFEFLGLSVVDVDGDGSPEVLCVGEQKLGVLFLARGGPELKEVGSIETDQEDVHYERVVIDDLNDDGRNDLLLTEIAKHQLEVFYRGPEEWKTGTRFKVFEERVFARGPRDGRGEPREVVTAELTGDGLTDIAIIVHDRVIVYPQQGEGEADHDDTTSTTETTE